MPPLTPPDERPAGARAIVARIAAAIAAHGAHSARTVVLVPYAQLMGVARAEIGRAHV